MELIYKKPYEFIKRTSKEIAYYLEQFNEITDELKEPIKSIWGDTDGEPICENWIYMTEEVVESIEKGRFSETTNGIHTEDHMDVTSPAYPFALFPLYYGSEALGHEFITMIKEADWEKIKQIQSRFFSQYSPAAGRWYAPKYWYLSPTQKSQAWIYIKERKEKLQNIEINDLSEDCKQCLHWVKQYGKSKYSTGVIHAFSQGSQFDIFGIVIKFVKKASSTELNYVWSQYKKLAA
jgi:hypothetical protein